MTPIQPSIYIIDIIASALPFILLAVTAAPRKNPNTCSGSKQSESASSADSPPATQGRLTPDDEADLHECEDTIERYLSASLNAGRALRRIRQRRLYRSAYDTFEAYVERRWSFGLRRAEQLMSSADVVDALSGAGVEDLPQNEAQTRPLTALDDDDMFDVWAHVLNEHGSAAKASKTKVEAVRNAILGETDELDSRPCETKRGSTETGGQRSRLDPTADWDKDARRALKKANKKHRDTIARLLNSTTGPNGVAVAITPEVVADAIEAFGAMALEDGLDDHATIVGTAASLIEEYQHAGSCTSTGDGAAGDLIPDLDILSTGELEHDAGMRRNAVFVGSVEKRPLLVSIPRIIAPRSLTEHLPEKATQVIVEIGEYERLGGPVKNGVLDIDEIRAAAREAKIKRPFTRTNEHVDWARYTTNPLTGCWHSCRDVFCYAAGIAQRLFAQGFFPTLYPARLDHFQNTRLPDVSGLEHDEAWRERSVFCVSMGDLFGGWVPSWYVELVLDEVRRHPGWFAFFLTKNPARLGDFSFPENAAVGLTITGDENGFSGPMAPAAQLAVYEKLAEKIGRVEGAAFTWLSLEPFRAPVHDLAPFFGAGVEMVAVGGQSRTAFAPARQPEIAWVEAVRSQVRGAGVRLFEKENLTVRPKEIPFPQGLPPLD